MKSYFILALSCLFICSPLVLRSSELLTQNQKIEQASLSSPNEEAPVTAALFSEQQSVQPGHPFWVAIQLKISKGWDTYWLNPGDAGFPTKVEWHLPEGFKAGALHWPYPERFVSQSLVGFGYTHDVVILAEITPPAETPLKNVDIKADVNWLACKDQCVPGSAELTMNMPVTATAPLPNNGTTSLFANARAHLPQSLAQEEGALTVGANAKELVMHLQPGGNAFKNINEVLFFPEVGEMVDTSAPQQLHKEKNGYVLNVKLAHPENALPGHVKGVLLISEQGPGQDLVKKAIQVDTDLQVTPQMGVHHDLNFNLAMLFAFLGGLILNVMPCVLPVIALKIMSFVKMGQEDRFTILKHGGVFGAGVLLSFWILSGILLVLRAYGEGVGWGFQLQEPVFVATLTLVLFILALSLFGIFELGTSLISAGQKLGPKDTSTLKSSFLSGVLATLVATPCTGPLLGPALGFAMTLPPISSLSIFTAMGCGMAAPYVLFSAFPALIRFLPKPGNWMVVFKQLMGFLMLATCLWLIWVLGAQVATTALFVLLASLLLIAKGAWIYGKWATPLKKKSTRWMATILAALLVTVGGTATLIGAKTMRETHTQGSTSDTKWVAYSPEKVAELRKQHIPVFVDFTAKWCLICQANKVILHSSEIDKAFQQKNVVTMSADWTKKDPVITKALQELGRTGVPVYVLYPGDEGQKPLILPQTLTARVVNSFLDKL